MTKYIFVTGGVVSSIGKGIVAASLGRLLKNRGLKVTIQKFDPYINIDVRVKFLNGNLKPTILKQTSKTRSYNPFTN